MHKIASVYTKSLALVRVERVFFYALIDGNLDMTVFQLFGFNDIHPMHQSYVAKQEATNAMTGLKAISCATIACGHSHLSLARPPCMAALP